MAGETEKATETEQSVEQTTEPSSALETEVKETEEEVIVEPQLPTELLEPEDHRERTRLGRKVAKLEENVNRVVGSLEQFLQEQRLTQMRKSEIEPEPEETIVSTSKDVETIVKRVIQRESEQQRQQREKYQVGYYLKMKELGVKDQSLYNDIEKEMLDNFNTIHTGNPSHDALINYSQAKASLLAKKTSTTKPKVPVANEPPEAPTVLASSTRVKVSETPMPKLSEEAQKLADYCIKQGMTEEEIKKALTEEVPLGVEPPILATK